MVGRHQGASATLAAATPTSPCCYGIAETNETYAVRLARRPRGSGPRPHADSDGAASLIATVIAADLLWTQGHKRSSQNRGDYMSAISGIHGDERDEDESRIHSEAPAEGDLDFDETEIRAHSMDPAEGANED